MTVPSEMAAPILELEGVHAEYGGIEALSGIDLAIPPVGVFALLGPNGAGKSTLLSVAAGMHPVAAGEVRVAGRPIAGATPVELARLGMCLVPEGRSIFPNLTVREHLRLITHVGVPIHEVEERVHQTFPILGERRNQMAGTLSGGEQQMLALSRALVTNPGLLLIDELSMGLAPLIVDRLYDAVAELAAAGTCVLAVEQFAHTVLGVADHAAILIGGRIVAQGAPRELAPLLSATYMGDLSP